MVRMRSNDEPPSRRELAAYADGSLAEGARARVEAALESSPQLRAEVVEQRRALRAIEGAAVPAPPRLRASLQAGRRGRPVRRAARPFALIAVAASTAALVAALFVAGGGAGAPTVAQAAALASRPATAPVPRGDRGSSLPGVRAAGLPYPYWQDRFGWAAAGLRRDAIGDRQATTVFYRHAGRLIGYTIVSGPPLALPHGSRTMLRAGRAITLLSSSGREVVVWPRHGHTCVLSGAGTSGASLIKLVADS